MCAFLLCGSGIVSAVDYVKISLADGFDFPVGKPDAKNYYKARGYHPKGHHGEDWNGTGGGNTDLGDSVYACGDGIVVQSRDVRVGWGNVVIIRHAYRESDGTVKFIDSLYGHLNTRFVTVHQRVKRGQRIGTIGTNRGMYLAHLHFEIRKNLYIGMHRSKFKKGYGNYWDPTYFIKTHRQCQPSSTTYRVPINTFQPYPAGSRDVASSKPPPGASIAKVESRKSITVPVERTKRTAMKTTSSSSSTSNTTRYMDSGNQRRTLSPTTQRIVAQQRKTTKPKPQPEAQKERKTIWKLFKKKVKTTSETEKKKKPIVRRRGLFRRR